MTRFEKSPFGFHVYHDASKHPIGWLKETSYRSGLFCVIHNKLGKAEQDKPRSLTDAKNLITKLTKGN